MRRRGALAASVVAWAIAVTACEDAETQVATAAPLRAGRFGSLRDLVLFERPDGVPGAALFVDRFEATRGDWAPFAATAAGRAVGAHLVPTSGDQALPVSLVNLRQARAFATWRYLRLPRYGEWQFATVGDGRSRFPWGSREDPTRANTSELGLGEPTPVGTFESGRRVGGGQPYDLIGNVSEWTESVPVRWCNDVLDPLAAMQTCCHRVLATPALAVWQGPGGLVPLVWAAQAGGEHVPREVVGADFQAPMSEGVLGGEAVPAGDRRTRTGLRLCSTAAELLAALAAEPAAPSEADVEQVRRFLRRDGHGPVLAAAWTALREANAIADPQLPLAVLLQAELGGAGLANGR